MDENQLKQRFGDRVKELRKKQGLTQQQLAERINASNTSSKSKDGGSSKQVIANIESGQKFVSAKMLGLLADALRVSTASLFRFKGPSDTQEHLEELQDILSDTDKNIVLMVTELAKVVVDVSANSAD